MPALGGELERLAQPAVALGALGDVDRVDRHPRAQRLDDRVAAGDPLGVAGSSDRFGRDRGRRGRLLGTLAPPCGALWYSRSFAFGVGPLTLEAALDPAAGAGGGVALAGLA